ncbi:MAG: FHA domain-containing protein [Cyanobacteria bacterium P01_D01_bin.156]
MSTSKAFQSSDQELNTLSIDADVIDALSLPWDAFFKNMKNDFDTANTVIDSLLTVQSRCQVTPFYVQAIIANSSIFLVSNAGCSDTLNLTQSGACWLLGKSMTCALPLENATVDPCHAVIRYTPDAGFFIADVGSQAGTHLNRRRLRPQTRQPLRDGDMIELGDLKVEFFVDNFDLLETPSDFPAESYEITYTGYEVAPL